MRKGWILPARVVGDPLDAQPEHQRHAAVAGLVLRIVAGEVANRERVGAARLRLDVLHQPREVAEVLPRQRPLRHLRPVHEVDLMARHVAVQEVIPGRVVGLVVGRDDIPSFACVGAHLV